MRQFHNWFKVDVSVPKEIKTSIARRQVSKRLKANQQAGRYIHIMDDDMFSTVKMMIESNDETNKQMATDIIFKSKMNQKQIDYFVDKWCYHLYTPPKNKG